MHDSTESENVSTSQNSDNRIDLTHVTEAIASVIASARKLHSDIKPLVAHISMQAKRAQAALQAIHIDWPQVTSVLDGVREVFAQLPERQRRAMLHLGQHGWYVDFELPFRAIFDFARHIGSDDHAAAEQVLCHYFDGRMAALLKQVEQNFGHRHQVLASAFLAHQRGDYDLSIPVILAQTDGICFEVTKVQLYTLSKSKHFRKAFPNADGAITAALLAPLSTELPLVLPQSKRTAHLPVLNRHAILHGESCDYGTRENSSRAISHLAYVMSVLSLTREARTQGKDTT